ncbi:39S ribosomal protein L30, mitochondrial [Halotydeus destructor]|nr:39S ribosomal protein L30, mitochondrial [Halotydeus destructor]
MRLNPFKYEYPKKRFYFSRFDKVDKWIKTNMYPNKKTYRGAFEAKRNENRCRPDAHFEELAEQIRTVQNIPVVQPSPIHMVWRHQPMYCRPWWEKVTLRKLGLNMKFDHERILIPNTPHYNRLLWEVKHLIRVKPITFPDGVPTEADIGRTKICTFTGTVRIGDQYKVSDERLHGDKKPFIYEGEYLMKYLRRLIGIFPGQHY